MKENLERIINTIQIPSSKPNPFETLTKSEFGVLELLIRGCANQEIIHKLHRFEDAIRFYIKKIYSKIGIPNKGPYDKRRKTTILYLIHHHKSFLNSYTKEELKNIKLIDDLTPRQLNILENHIMGCSYRKIAGKLGISENMVQTHMSNIFYKLDIEREGETKKNIKALRLYVLHSPEIIPSLYCQVKNITANSKKEIDIQPILSNVTFKQNLTSRELEILGELVKGGSNKELAARLFLDETTVRSYITHINKKQGIKMVGISHPIDVRPVRQKIYMKILEKYDNSKK